MALYKPRLDALAVDAVTGDQADVATLEGWVKDTQGGFDVIVDDGGDQNQTLASFTVLLQKALKPGGVIVIEDMHVSRRGHWRGTGPIMLDVLRDWQESLLTRHVYSPNGDHIPPMDIKSIECMAEACIITKCVSDDTTCPFFSCEKEGDESTITSRKLHATTTAAATNIILYIYRGRERL